KRGTFVPQPSAQPADKTLSTTNLADFPYAYYLRQVAGKVREKWDAKALPGQQPAVIFEIERDGRVNQARIDKSSGNSLYDQVAIQAVNDAGPFPPLPEEFTGPTLVVELHLGFGPPASVKAVLRDERDGIEGEPISLDSTDPAYSVYLDRVRRMI